MTLKTYFPFSETFANATTVYLQADGVERTNAQNPAGLADNLIISDGVLASTMRDTDDYTYFGHRADISWPSEIRAEYWYTWRVMIPESWSGYGKRLVVAQIHDRNDVGDPSQSPNFALYADNRELTAVVPESIYPTAIADGVPKGGIPIVLGQWYDCCLHANWQISGGFREFFINRVPIFREYGVPTEYDNVLGPYLKIGLYDGYHWGDFGTKTAYFSDVKIWTGNDGYGTVMGGVPVSPLRHVAL